MLALHLAAQNEYVLISFYATPILFHIILLSWEWCEPLQRDQVIRKQKLSIELKNTLEIKGNFL